MSAEPAGLTAILEHGAKSLGIGLPAEALALFETYFKLLENRGRNVNLTAISGAEDVARLHFLDSIALLNAFHFKDSSVIDIGSGAGFPGVALKIAEPSINLTLLDSTGKRVAFLNELCAALGINANCLHARAEDASRTPPLRENHDIAVSRAVANLNILCELCLPFVRPGGAFIAMKGVDSADELEKAHNAIRTLGAEFLECFDYHIPGTDIVHRAIIIRKFCSTHDIYPRRYAKIGKSPL